MTGYRTTVADMVAETKSDSLKYFLRMIQDHFRNGKTFNSPLYVYQSLNAYAQSIHTPSRSNKNLIAEFTAERLIDKDNLREAMKSIQEAMQYNRVSVLPQDLHSTFLDNQPSMFNLVDVTHSNIARSLILSFDTDDDTCWEPEVLSWALYCIQSIQKNTDRHRSIRELDARINDLFHQGLLETHELLVFGEIQARDFLVMSAHMMNDGQVARSISSMSYMMYEKGVESFEYPELRDIIMNTDVEDNVPNSIIASMVINPEDALDPHWNWKEELFPGNEYGYPKLKKMLSESTSINHQHA